jgi:DNA-directed RNA polymerase subunit RPC12/RpoP
MRHEVTAQDFRETTLYHCPVCGIDLIRADFDTPECAYWCPFCSTRQIPRATEAGPKRSHAR